MAVLAPNGQLTLDVTYSSRGLDDWRYALASNGVADDRDFLRHFRDAQMIAIAQHEIADPVGLRRKNRVQVNDEPPHRLGRLQILEQ